MSPRQALAPPRDLTIPEPGSTTARDVFSRALGRLLAELPSIVRAHAQETALGTVLAGLDTDGKGALVASMRRPQVGVLLRSLRVTAPGQGAALARELVALVLFELAWAGALPFDVTLRDLPPRIVSIEHCVVVDLAGIREVSLHKGHACLRTETEETVLEVGGAFEGPRITRPFFSLEGNVIFSLADNNPLAMSEAHPDKHGNAIELGEGHAEAEWVDVLRSSFALVRAHMPELYQEMQILLSAIVPVGCHVERHESASYREAIGSVYMTLHPNVMTMTEALIHEYQHNKLNALFEVDDVLTNAFEPLYPSPVRPDPRPLHGVLLALHAFLPVARLYELMLASDDPRAQSASFRARFQHIIRMNQEAADVVLRHARPTAVGRGLFDDLGRWNARFSQASGSASTLSTTSALGTNTG